METNLAEITKALVAAQLEMEAAKKTSDNPFFKSKYADLKSVQDAVLPALNKNGIAVVQMMGQASAENRLMVITKLMHVSGQILENPVELPIIKNDPQAIGSLISYGRRYGLQTITGCAQEDDDGEGAHGRKGGKESGKFKDAPKVEKPKPASAPSPGFDELSKSLAGPGLFEFLRITSEANKTDVETLKTRAAGNFEAFKNAFSTWQKKEQESKKPTEMAPSECPDRPGDIMTAAFCEKCKSRAGCPVWADAA